MSIERDGMEIWLNGLFLGRGSVTNIVETEADEKVTPYGHTLTPSERRQRAEIVVKQPERSEMELKGQWLIKKYVDGEATETNVASHDAGSKVLEYLRSAEIEGTYELVCRPETKDAVVESHHLDAGPSEDEEAPGSPGLFDESKKYIDREGDVWSCHESRWSFKSPGAGPLIGSFASPVAGPFKVLEGAEDFDKSDQLTQSFNMSKTYIDKDGDKWRWREDKDSDHLGEWVCYHRLDEDELTWEPIPPVIYGPYTEEDE